MLSLESCEWSNLSHAYGNADDIPKLLSKLGDYPATTEHDSEPFFSLWSSLCHQGDTCTAAYAAVPHLLGLAKAAPGRITYDYLLLPTSIEIARLTGRGPEVPASLQDAYQAAIQSMTGIIGQLPANEMNETLCLICCAAIAVAAGNGTIAEAVLELEGEAAAEFLKWKFEQ